VFYPLIIAAPAAYVGILVDGRDAGIRVFHGD
jgi:hypothetical protein